MLKASMDDCIRVKTRVGMFVSVEAARKSNIWLASALFAQSAAEINSTGQFSDLLPKQTQTTFFYTDSVLKLLLLKLLVKDKDRLQKPRLELISNKMSCTNIGQYCSFWWPSLSFVQRIWCSHTVIEHWREPTTNVTKYAVASGIQTLAPLWNRKKPGPGAPAPPSVVPLTTTKSFV